VLPLPAPLAYLTLYSDVAAVPGDHFVHDHQSEPWARFTRGTVLKKPYLRALWNQLQALWKLSMRGMIGMAARPGAITRFVLPIRD
jgi:hypothetical protein